MFIAEFCPTALPSVDSSSLVYQTHQFLGTTKGTLSKHILPETPSLDFTVHPEDSSSSTCQDLHLTNRRTSIDDDPSSTTSIHRRNTLPSTSIRLTHVEFSDQIQVELFKFFLNLTDSFKFLSNHLHADFVLFRSSSTHRRLVYFQVSTSYLGYSSRTRSTFLDFRFSHGSSHHFDSGLNRHLPRTRRQHLPSTINQYRRHRRRLLSLIRTSPFRFDLWFSFDFRFFFGYLGHLPGVALGFRTRFLLDGYLDFVRFSDYRG